MVIEIGAAMTMLKTGLRTWDFDFSKLSLLKHVVKVLSSNLKGERWKYSVE